MAIQHVLLGQMKHLSGGGSAFVPSPYLMAVAGVYTVVGIAKDTHRVYTWSRGKYQDWKSKRAQEQATTNREASASAHA